MSEQTETPSNERTRQQRSRPGDGKSQAHGPDRDGAKKSLFLTLYAAVVGLALMWMLFGGPPSGSGQAVPYSRFKQALAAGDVVSVEVGPNTIRGTMKVAPGKAAATSGPISTPAAASNAAAARSTSAGAGSGHGAVKKAAETATATHAPKPAAEATSSTASNTTPSAPRQVAFSTVRMQDPKLVDELTAHGVKVTAVRPNGTLAFLLSWIVPIGLIWLAWWYFTRRLAGQGRALLSIGKSNAKIAAETDVHVSFDDVAGCEEAKTELREVVEFLREPSRFTTVGAAMPRGVLLVGPPGTGKTLLARAVAGEAKVPFFSLSGSDFVEMFVGVGASRVRDLFKQAKDCAPCIVFIDELDAIGRARAVHVAAVNDEREHTLNQLLVEMDGFEPNAGVIILAATNRPDVLDQALLRPGRFDRQVVLDAPDLAGRKAILRLHLEKKHVAPHIDLDAIARETPGLSGADLANVTNEAALLAARRGRDRITGDDLEAAVEKVVAGPERRSRRLDRQERQRVAYHEVGHALVAVYSRGADPVRKISIVPRGRAALGYTLQLPEGERFMQTRTELLGRIRGLLGGRVAEEIVFGDVSTGAENDLEAATAIARNIVCRFGMGDSAGLMHCTQPAAAAFLTQGGHAFQRDCSEATAHAVDLEVKALLADAYHEARAILEKHRGSLDQIAETLLEEETLDGDAFRKLAGVGTRAPRRNTAHEREGSAARRPGGEEEAA
jgi:cell division protease FtsH